MDTGRGEERVRCMERVMWKLMLPYVKYVANGNLLYVSGNSKLGLCIYLVGGEREGDGKEVQEGGDKCIPTADSC